MSQKVNNEVLLGAFIVGAGGLLAYMALAVGGFSTAPGVHVKAKFASAAGLVKDANVSIAGVEVGKVEGLAVEHDHAVVSLFVRQDAGVRQDVVAAVRAKSLLGEKYVELLPQSSSAPLLADGGEIGETRSSVEVDELLAALGPVIKQVDPNDVAKLVKAVATTVDSEQGSIQKLLRNAGEASEHLNGLLAKNGTKIDGMIGNLSTLSASGAKLVTEKGPTLARTLDNADKLTTALAADTPGLLAKADRVAGRLDKVTGEIEAGAPHLGRDLGKTLKSADAALVGLQKLSGRVGGTLDQVDPLLKKANAIDEEQIRSFASELLLNTGIKVYMHPFGPAYTKQQQPAGK